MPNLAVLAKDVLARAGQVQEREKGKQFEGQLAQRLSTLRDLKDQLRDECNFEGAWVAAGLAPFSDETTQSRGGQALNRLEAMIRDQASDPNAVLADGSFRLLLRSLEGAIASLGTAASAAWAIYSQQALPPALGADEQLLRADPRTSSEVVDRLLSWDKHLRSLASKVRPSSAELVEFMQVLASRQAVWSSVEIEQDPEVVTFIRAGGDRGAPLTLLTSKVIEWLKDSGLFDEYIIRKRP